MFGTQDNADDRRRFTRRLTIVGLAQLAGFGLIAGRLYQLQVLDQRQYGELADANRIMRQVRAPLRGRILGRDGRVLADTKDTFQALLTPSLAGDIGALLERIGRIRPLDAAARRGILQAVRSGAPSAPLLVADDLTWAEVAAFNFHAPLLAGVHTEVAGKRIYETGPELGRIVGYVGRVARFAMDDDPVLRLAQTRVGKSGVERALEARLKGEAGHVTTEVDARRRSLRTLETVEPKRGSDVALTIDAGLQKRLLDRLAQHRRAAAAVLDVATGDIVAMAAHPTFDVSRLGSPISADEWRRVREAQGDPLVDRSYQGVYPPGSTTKMITALAALEAGVVAPDEAVDCTGAFVLAGHRFRCWNRGGHGPCNLHRALSESCDVYFYEVARRTGIERLAEMARRFGLGEAYEAGLEPIKSGLVPDPEWKRGRFGTGWLPGETLLAGIGQGYMLATPLQLAVMTARLASGRRITPTIVHPRIGGEDKPEAIGVDAAHLRAVQRGMWAAVNERGGTAKNARIADGRVSMVGKTGTAQVARISSRVARDNLPWRLRDHALFVGYVADPAPRYAAAAIVEHGGGGGEVAAPLVRGIIEDALALDPAARPVFDIAANRHRSGDGGR